MTPYAVLYAVLDPIYALDGTVNRAMRFNQIATFNTGLFGYLGVVMPNGFVETLVPVDSNHEVYRFHHDTEVNGPLYCFTRSRALNEKLGVLGRQKREATEALRKIEKELDQWDYLNGKFDSDISRLEAECRIDAMHRSISHDD